MGFEVGLDFLCNWVQGTFFLWVLFVFFGVHVLLWELLDLDLSLEGVKLGTGWDLHPLQLALDFGDRGGFVLETADDWLVFLFLVDLLVFGRFVWGDLRFARHALKPLVLVFVLVIILLKTFRFGFFGLFLHLNKSDSYLIVHDFHNLVRVHARDKFLQSFFCLLSFLI